MNKIKIFSIKKLKYKYIYKARIQTISNEIKKQESRDQYYKNLSAKIKELENKRSENAFNKSLEKNQFKKEYNSKIMERIDSK